MSWLFGSWNDLARARVIPGALLHRTRGPQWRQSPPSVGGRTRPGPQGASGLKESVLKMGTLIDQRDEMEFRNHVNRSRQNYIFVMGSGPEEAVMRLALLQELGAAAREEWGEHTVDKPRHLEAARNYGTKKAILDVDMILTGRWD